tara:strand:+ start:1743 stop:2135 length:393 start_codon:yes stop_codon:yes gene_type:complete
MRAGLLNYRVNFKEPTDVIDEYGDRTTTFTTYEQDVWAAVQFIGSPSAGASEEELDNQTVGKVKIEVKCRFFGTVGSLRGPNFRDVIEFEGADFDIYDIQVIGRRELYKIRAEARDDLTTVSHSQLPFPS